MRLLSYALQCGLNERGAWATNPGRIIDLYLWRMEYDAAMHRIPLKAEGGSDDGD